jgi:hypothetical protein
MTPRARITAAAWAGLIAVILVFAVYYKIRHSSLETAPGQAAETSSPEAAINPAALPHAPSLVSHPSYTNEELQEFLEQDKKRLGIKKIYTQDELRALKASDNQPNKTQMAADRAKIRAMTQEIQAVVEARKKPPVVLSGDKTKLLSSPEDSYSASGSPLSGNKSANPPADSQK